MSYNKTKRYTLDEDTWLIDNHTNYGTLEELTDNFNKNFENKRSIIAIKTRIYGLGLRKHKYFTKEESKFIKNNFYRVDLDTLYKEYKKKFPTSDKSLNSIENKCKRMGFYCNSQ